MASEAQNWVSYAALTLASGAELLLYVVKESSGMLNLRLRLGGETDRYVDTPLTPKEAEQVLKILTAMARGRA